MKKNTLIVLGMHRSGTSLMANWLHELGINMGYRLLAGDFSNEKGHFEDLDFLDLHKQLLTFNNQDLNGLKGKLEISINEYWEKRIRHLIQLKNDLHDQWGWKEPRTCLLLDFYQITMPEAKYIVMYRNYQDVIDSLVRRDFKRSSANRKSSLKTKVKGLLKSLLTNKKSMQEKARINYEMATNEYLHVSYIYYNRILNFLKKQHPENYMLITMDDMIQQEDKIKKQLTLWGFAINSTSIKKLYHSNLLSKKITFHTSDNSLQLKTEKVVNEILNFRSFSN